MSTYLHDAISLNRRGLSRRRFLSRFAAGGAALGTLGLSDWVGLQAAELKKRGKSLIVLWMAGGPSHLETFDPKPDHENGGETKAISTSVPGIQIANGWERTAEVMNDLAVIRSMTNKEGNHQRASYQLHTGYVPSGSVKHPAFGSAIAKEIGSAENDLPPVVTIGQGGFSTSGTSAGFLGVDYDPFEVPTAGSPPANTSVPTGRDRFRNRLGLLSELESEFASRGGETVVENHRRLYGKASRMVLSKDLDVFDISREPDALRKSYGETAFGKGCLLARRLVEKGVSYVEVRLNGWDTHTDVFERVNGLSQQVDPAFATLVSDLKQRGKLDDTVVLWMGEFGRTPKVNPRGGRDHYPRVFNAVMAGGGIKGGQVVGSSTADGSAVESDPVTVGDLFETVCSCLNVDSTTENISPLGRPIRIVDEGARIEQLFG